MQRAAASDNQLTEQDAHDASAAMRAQATHLVVFQHGLLGSEADFANARALFQTHLGGEGGEGVYAHIAQCNVTRLDSLAATCDGIDCGAARLASEIVRVAGDMPRLEKFSLVGHSMGGLYARYCIGLLYARGFFDRVEPVNFVTLATPHLGNRRPKRGSVNFLYNAIAPRLFDRTGSQFALADEASDEAIALSKRCLEDKYPHRCTYAAYPKMEGVLPVQLDGDDAFVPRRCALRDRVLCIYAKSEAPETAEEVLLARIELLRADVAVKLPDKASDSRQDWDITIQPQDDDASSSFTLRIAHQELKTHWKWIPALSNAAFGIDCRSRELSSTSAKTPSARPALLACLARGQFLQALELFRVRALYATVFNDHTVPYSCAALRAFNPYRLEPNNGAAALATSPYYDHVVQRSIAQTPLLRQTLPVDAKIAATRKSTANVLKAKELEAAASSSSNQSGWAGTLYSLFSSGAGAAVSAPAPTRAAPFTDEQDARNRHTVLVDRADDAFSTDEARDTLRGMLLALQSVGWRRVDVSLDSLLAHEMVIAKRADIANAPCDGGLDILHHVMDTIEL